MAVNGKDLARMIDSTSVGTLVTKQVVDEMIEQAKEYEFFAINGPASYFPYLEEQLKGTNTNPGFGCTRWSGADPSHCKAYAAKWAVESGAKEIDMVMNISFFKSGLYEKVVRDISTVKDAIGDHALKVIIECPLLDEQEIVKASALVIEGGADCIKSCTGMEGACTLRDIELIMGEARNRVWVKAAGGIRSLDMVDAMMELGVTRFGVNYMTAKLLCDEANERSI